MLDIVDRLKRYLTGKFADFTVRKMATYIEVRVNVSGMNANSEEFKVLVGLMRTYGMKGRSFYKGNYLVQQLYQ